MINSSNLFEALPLSHAKTEMRYLDLLRPEGRPTASVVLGAIQ